MTADSALITAQQLSQIAGNPKLRLIDATYGQPSLPVSILNAVDFDIDAVADLSAPLAHTIPSADDFARAVTHLGIHNDDLVVVYDANGMAFAAARVWWMFRLFGHDNVRVLDGGLPAWLRAGYTVTEKQDGEAQGSSYVASFQPQLIKTKSDILANIDNGDFLLLDARDPARFYGTGMEPRPGMGSGHIPKSRNLPFAALIDDIDGTMKDAAALKDIIQAARLDLQKPLAVSCGSGVTACVVALALHTLGYKEAAIYDGSWTEWASDAALPKETGA